MALVMVPILQLAHGNMDGIERLMMYRINLFRPLKQQELTQLLQIIRGGLMWRQQIHGIPAPVMR